MTDKQSNNGIFEELCAGYVLQALDEDERTQFEQMLDEASQEELDLYREMRAAANHITFTVEGNVPSDDVKEELMEQVRSTAEVEQGEQIVVTESPSEGRVADSKEQGFQWPAFTAAASFALLIICLSLIFYVLSLNSEINEKEEFISRREAEIEDLHRELEHKEELMAALEGREVEAVGLSGMDSNPEGYGKIIWNPETRQALLQVSNLPAVPEGKEYQLWLIKNNKPVSAGLFAVREEGDQFFRIDDIAATDEVSANTFIVTVEPEGGMPSPTGDTYLMGSIGEE